ncbi:hypothetical protein MA16_Dca027573 [Dendrobium catenatum]|uniref:Uncharacterized protein n=1 Tax=Dendrobium catenatum TaxID=906689 RepID=A0A2I0WWM3_9ASPA|nr:hypothetical protein MA16_Dca027573 [Dendrobium catenatum]
MAAEDRRTTVIGGQGDVRQITSGNGSSSNQSLPVFGDVAAGGFNIGAQEARLKMKNNQGIVINEGGLASLKKNLPDIGKGKGILDSSFKFDNHSMKSANVSWNYGVSVDPK